MRTLGKYWKAIFAVVLVIVSVLLIFAAYLPGKWAYETEYKRLTASISTLQGDIQENLRYADMQEEIAQAEEQLEESRAELYAHFPQELKEEDQIMYVVYLEELFGTDITFSFGSASRLKSFSDRAELDGLTLTVNYETDYEGYKEMIRYLATDERITSIQYSTMDYDAESDTASGSLTLLLYALDAGRDYQPPEVNQPSTGKPNIFD